jgi:exodeoxyribonuclease V beta subunit
MQPLDILTMPLNGKSLIEASAGTGKTYTISHLMLRLLLLPQDKLSEKPLSIENILVVTFTKAATQELKDRIRANIQAAQDYVSTKKAGDKVLKAIVDESISQHGDDVVFKLCRQAILSMDDAPIFTIHGFCQRVLGEFSFQAQQSYDQNLLENNKAMIAELSEQLWRESFYHLSDDAAEFCASTLKNPEHLRKRFDSLSDETLIKPFSRALESIMEDVQTSFSRARTCYESHSQDIHQIFIDGVGGNSFTKSTIPKRLNALRTFFDNSPNPYIKSDVSQWFSQSFINEKTKQAPQHSFFDIMDSLNDALEELVIAFLNEALVDYQAMMTKEKSEANVMFFDDLVKNFALAVGEAESVSGEASFAAGEASRVSELLKIRLRSQYPIALIDEFQDTDQWQYQIFREIYHQEQNMGLLMIGDPKQAIYGFRGADIHTYFKARNDVASEKQYTLATNWRSHPQLVQQVNSLFRQIENPFVQQGFPEYPDVGSPPEFKDKVGLLTSEGEASFSVIALEGEGGLPALRDEAATKTASFIADCLNKPSTLNGKQLQPKDICILVRKGKQAKQMKDALAAEGVNSVYLSKESVLQSDEAISFIRLLLACADPYDLKAIYTALGDGLIQYSTEKIYALQNDAKQLQTIQEAFLLANETWQKKGFMPMWQALLQVFEIGQKLLSQSNGERRFTNLNQLAEIFQALDKNHLSHEQQIEKFKQWVSLTESDEEHYKMRLDTEANLVSIVTIHYSKGLQYPMICCPYLFDGSSPSDDDFIIVDENTQQRKIAWKGDKKAKAQTELNELAEDVRLLYVALTRAEYHVNLCWGKVKDIDKTALWHVLLERQTKVKNVEGEVAWKAFTEMSGCVINPEAGQAFSEDVSQKGDALPEGSVKTLTRSLEWPYKARSYSALLLNAHQSHHQEKDHDEFDEVKAEDVEFEWNIFHFPKGAEAGNFMHHVFEFTSFTDHETTNPEVIKTALERYDFDEQWQPVLERHFSNCLKTPFNKHHVSLSELPEEQLAKEMDFHWVAKSIDGAAIAKLLSSFRDTEAEFAFQEMEGYFKGFIDLVFEHNGQYFVLDYKSNFLGFTSESYNFDAMHEAMQSHYYDLQYLFYVAALQRYLKQLIKDYDYEAHIGGVYYLFVRGMVIGSDTGIYYVKPPKSVIDQIESFFEANVLSLEV